MKAVSGKYGTGEDDDKAVTEDEMGKMENRKMEREVENCLNYLVLRNRPPQNKLRFLTILSIRNLGGTLLLASAQRPREEVIWKMKTRTECSSSSQVSVECSHTCVLSLYHME